MKLNKKGIVAETLLVYIIVAGALLFIQNPISSALGVGVRPNKTSHVEKVQLINDGHGNIVATKTIVKDDDIQQRITLWEWLKSLPIFVLILMGLGVVFPPLALILGRLWAGLKKETKKIVVSIDKALDNVHDTEVKKAILKDLATVQNDSTKKLVDEIQGK